MAPLPHTGLLIYFLSADVFSTRHEEKRDGEGRQGQIPGVSQEEAERRAWATVNKESGGGNKSGSGRGGQQSSRENGAESK